jgi:hypothetical protein
MRTRAMVVAFSVAALSGILMLSAAAVLAQQGPTSREVAAGVPRSAQVTSRARTKPVTAAQRDQTIDRVTRAQAIVARMEPQARAKGLSSEWRRALLEALLPLGAEALGRVESHAPSLDLLAETIVELKDDPTLIGDPNKDLMFTPIAPCRYIDTRNAVGKIAGVRAYNGDANGSSYGGSAACNLLSLLGVSNANQIGALAMNVTIVDTSTAGTPGFVAVKPNAASPTTSLLNWYQAGTSVQVANQGVVTLDQASGTEFVIETSGAVHVIVDVFGAFVEPQATAIETVRTVQVADVPPGSFGSASAICPGGYSLLSVGCETDDPDNVISRLFSFSNSADCSTRNTGSLTTQVSAHAVCGRVPGR